MVNAGKYALSFPVTTFSILRALVKKKEEERIEKKKEKRKRKRKKSGKKRMKKKGKISKQGRR